MAHILPVHIGAVDLGASSGRVMVGTFDGESVTLTEVRRFSNAPIPVPTDRGTRLYWDVLRLWDEIRQGLAQGARDVGPLSVVGIDSWAVDYGIIDEAGVLSTQMASYRCQRTAGVPQEVFAKIPAQDFYRINGLQVQPFNTVFQLIAEQREGGLAAAHNTVLLLPDLLAYWLTGQRVAEVTNASTMGLIDARTRRWSAHLLEELRDKMSLDVAPLLPTLVESGALVGTIRPEVGDLRTPAGALVPVIAVGTHDTASAVAAVPAAGNDFAYISCGTWSLVGLELDEPVLTEASRAANFTNELGVDSTVRYLKNVMGLWVFNEAVRTWREQGYEASYRDLDAAAEYAEPLRTVVDINDERFFAPGDMAARIDAYAKETGQAIPRSLGEYVRCIDDSLALAYRRAVRQAVALSGREVSVLHMVGGGIRNRLLCQLAADATGLPVIAGPEEGTAMGNILVAARGAGIVEGDLADLRAIVRASTSLLQYAPHEALALAWDEAEARIFG
ncbi:rhamnulokinase [Schaalia suimastitidis]|uniref:rhamnulokinase n=1 Tax=Schaalia suimastitidis TaxID=121163 RepID=UPI00040DFC9E|nr:rhamnulokinase family protein [Schaalia suimastitidis]